MTTVLPMNELNSTLRNETPSRLGTSIGATIAFVSILFGLIGDFLIITAILKKKELRSNHINLFIVSLQLNDIINIGFNQFFVGLAYAFMKWTGPFIICEIVVYSSIISTGALLWHHALIAIHRYLIVVHNKTQSSTILCMSQNVYVLVSTILARIIPTTVCMPSFFKKMIEYSPSGLRCMLAPKVGKFQNQLIFMLNMILPCFIVVFCFARIFTRVHKVSKNIRKSCNYNNNKSIVKNDDESEDKQKIMQKNGNNNNNNQKPETPKKSSHKIESVQMNMKREIQITKMFAIIFVVFLFGYLPYGLVRSIDTSNSLHPDVYIFFTVLFIISISVSPVIYGLMNKQIRNEVFNMLSLNCNTKSPIRKKVSLKKKFDQKRLSVDEDIVAQTVQNGTSNITELKTENAADETKSLMQTNSIN